MTHRWLKPLIYSAAFTAIVSLQPVPAAAASAKTEKAPAAPRTKDGHPDFSGIWTNVTLTPFERPADLAGKEYFTEQEAREYEKQTVSQRNRDRRTPGSERDVANAYNDFWWDSGTKVVKTRRTSIVVDPPDGRIPSLTAARQQQLAARAEAIKKRCEQQPGCQPENSGLLGPADGPEDRPLMERCLYFGGGGPPMLPGAYNNNYQFVQGPNFLAIDVEMVHDVRRVPLDGSNHLPAGVGQWMGDSRGHWEGDTLVVDTTNFTDQTRFRGSDGNLHLTERFTFLDADTIIYRFTVDDPTAFTKAWTGEIPFVRTEGPLYEYACNEGNTGLAGILASARSEEKKAAAKTSK
ncbi:MAG: hypothetical protein C5B51_14410 [Terriglobia bacterium]|nr:MAG: hypothetical protein C5B51_14410 [Terriglobia bacterium]